MVKIKVDSIFKIFKLFRKYKDGVLTWFQA